MHIALIEPDNDQAETLSRHLDMTRHVDAISVFVDAFGFLTSSSLSNFDLVITEQRLPFVFPNPDTLEQLSQFPELTLPLWDLETAGSRLLEYLRARSIDCGVIIYTTSDMNLDREHAIETEQISDRAFLCFKLPDRHNLDEVLNALGLTT